MCLFRHLLDSFPYKASRLFAECQQDIPPLYRGRTWAAILGALDSSLDESTFWLLDTFCDQQTDRQLQVDIPRCHQYDELMSSPCAHHNLKLGIIYQFLLKK
jgi:TBC domain-containing protein kinase-like protein